MVKWIDIHQKLDTGTKWYELREPFYAWLARNAVPYYESPSATSGNPRFAKVRYEDFTKCVLPVMGRKAKKLKRSYNFVDDDFDYPDMSSCPSTDIENSEPEDISYA